MTATLDDVAAVIAAVQGKAAPTLTGEGPYHTFREKGGREGGRCEYPGAAIRKGYRVDYHPDTREITVGADWVCSAGVGNGY